MNQGLMQQQALQAQMYQQQLMQYQQQMQQYQQSQQRMQQQQAPVAPSAPREEPQVSGPPRRGQGNLRKKSGQDQGQGQSQSRSYSPERGGSFGREEDRFPSRSSGAPVAPSSFGYYVPDSTPDESGEPDLKRQRYG